MNCIVCEQEIPALRLKILPNTKTCVNCSTESPKRGRILNLGEGDHTYTEIEILDQETYSQVMHLEKREFYDADEPLVLRMPGSDEDDNPEQPSFQDVINKIKLDDEGEEAPAPEQTSED